MDKFLDAQNTGRVVDTRNSFTIDRGRSRQKTLDSIPKTSLETVFRLLDSAAWQLQAPTESKVWYCPGSKYSAPQLFFSVSGASEDFLGELFDELRRPFGAPSAAANLARAMFLATKLGGRVAIAASSGVLSSRRLLELKPGELDLPDEGEAPLETSFNVVFGDLDYGYSKFEDYRKSLCRGIYTLLEYTFQILPLESLTKEVSGYFDYRAKPFTVIRSYASCPSDDEKIPGMQFDLWDGLYSQLNEQTLLLSRKKPKRFLFLRWRPKYGRPTFLHHSLDDALEFGSRKYRATFWVETSDSGAHVFIYSDNVVSDPIPVKGPPGLKGLVVWPGLKYDLWGTRLVKDDEYEKALEWIQARVQQTADVLKENLPKVLELVKESDLLKSSYAEETMKKMSLFWG